MNRRGEAHLQAAWHDGKGTAHRARRAQFEIMGLAIVIVLVVLGATFFLTHPWGGSVSSATQDYADQQLAQRLVDAYLRTDVGAACPGYTMYDLVRDAAMIGADPCMVAGVGDGSERSNDTLARVARGAIDNTTGSRYVFTVATDESGATPIVLLLGNGGCPPGRGTAIAPIGEQRIPLLPTQRVAVVSLELCTVS